MLGNLLQFSETLQLQEPVLKGSTLIGCSLFCAAVSMICYYLFSERQRGRSEPPVVPGSRLWGNGPQFQKNAVEFLLQSRRKFGDLFTIRFPGHHIHMLMNPHSISEFSRTKALDFEPIHKQVTTNVFSFEMQDSHKMLRNASKAARAALKDDVFRYGSFVEEGLQQKVAASSEWRREMLDDFLGDTQFRAIFNSIFGRSDEHVFNHSSARSLFADIHSSFNFVWLGFPIWMFPRTRNAWKQLRNAHPQPEELLQREDCSVYIKSVMETMMEKQQAMNSIIGHNMVYLHVNYNTKKATYWAINNLLRDAKAYEHLRAEVDAVVQSRLRPADSLEEGEENVLEFSSDEIDRLPLLDSFIKETFRLSSGVFMIRQVTEDTVLNVEGQDFLLRKGDKAAMYPPALHRDPEMYSSPNEFQFDRFVDADVQFRGQPVAKPILPYGVLCPGQRLSLIQFKWFVFALLAKLELRSGGELAEYDFNSYGHEILPPVKDVAFEFKQRPSTAAVELRLS